jgi:galactonate dehydratase
MKITGCKVFPVSVPSPSRGGSEWIFVRLDTDAGISGYSELYLGSFPYQLRTIVGMVEDAAETFVIGNDPHNRELLFANMYGSFYTHNTDMTKQALLSAFDVACWDILGKAAQQPLYNLLGGLVRDKVRTYTYIFPDDGDNSTLQDLWQSPDHVAMRAKHYADLGFTALKFDPLELGPVMAEDGLGQLMPAQYPASVYDRAESVVAAVHEAVGGQCDLLIGTHGQMTASSAIRFARRIERFDPLWYEEPIPPENAVELAKVARATTIPITVGERLSSKHDVLRVIQAGAVSTLNVDVGQVGGVTEFMKIAALADANCLQVAPHVYGGPLLAAASINLSLTLPNFLIMEALETYDKAHAELLEPAITWKDGFVHHSGLPGLGYELNEDVAKALRPE